MKNLKACALAIGVVAFAAVAFAAYNNDTATGYTNVRTGNVKITDIGVYDSAGILRYTPGASNAIVGNVTVSGGTFAVLSSTAPRSADPNVAITPPSAGAIVFNSTDKELCVSSGTTSTTWIEVSTLAVVACRH